MPQVKFRPASVCLAEQGDDPIEDGYGDDEDADEWLVCVFHDEWIIFYLCHAVGLRLVPLKMGVYIG